MGVLTEAASMLDAMYVAGELCVGRLPTKYTRFSMASSRREPLAHVRQLSDEVARVGAQRDTRTSSYLHEKLGIPAMQFVSMDGADFSAPQPPQPHGNIKSGNILLDADLQPRIVDYGFFPLVNAPQLAHASFAFRSPEVAAAQQQQQRVPVSASSNVSRRNSQVLELITGRFPSQYFLNAHGGTDVVNWAAAADTRAARARSLTPSSPPPAGPPTCSWCASPSSEPKLRRRTGPTWRRRRRACAPGGGQAAPVVLRAAVGLIHVVRDRLEAEPFVVAHGPGARFPVVVLGVDEGDVDVSVVQQL